MKRQRQGAILEIIKAQAVETQEELMEALKKRGYNTAQATISRDMKELSLVKKLGQGGQRYCVSSVEKSTEIPPTLSHIVRDGVISVVAAQNLVVIKTKSGLAMAVCTALDEMEISGMVGSLAGDDTCFLAMTDQSVATDATFKIRKMTEIIEH